MIIIKLMNIFSLNDRELALEVGLGHSIIARLRTDPNVNPTISTISPIAKYFNVTIDQIINNTIELDEVILNFKQKLIPILTNKSIKMNDNDLTNHNTMRYYGTKHAENIFCYHVLTNEYEPFVRKNSRIIFSKNIKLKDNIIVLAYFNKKINICKLIANNDNFKLKSLKFLNKNPIPLSEIENILGILIEIIF